MRYALRRVLWLLPTLLILSAVAFWLCSGAARASGAERRDRTRAAVPQEAIDETRLPRFVNTSPRDCRSQALDALGRLSLGDGRTASAAADLARLGGAALPHV